MDENYGGTGNYPSKITFKSVYRKTADLDQGELIMNIFRDEGLDLLLESRESGAGTFISYTITAEFSSKEHVQSVCQRLSSLSGFMMLF